MGPLPRNLSVMTFVMAVILLAFLVALVASGPLRLGGAVDHRDDERRAALEAAKEAKYREIRDAELDYRMGKLGEGDYRSIDRELRAQAIGILKELDKLDAEPPSDSAPVTASSNGQRLG